jgi:stress-induced morphogen
MVSGPELEDKLSKSLSTLYVKAVDESDGCGAKFLIVVVSEAFNGKNKIAQHRLVHSAIAGKQYHI